MQDDAVILESSVICLAPLPGESAACQSRPGSSIILLCSEQSTAADCSRETRQRVTERNYWKETSTGPDHPGFFQA